MNTATSLDKKIDAWTVIRDPNDITKRLSLYSDPNTDRHFNDAGWEAILATI
jgi:hypothetical protein